MLNEIHPWPRADLNGDGKIDGGDEFIEIINISNFAVPLTNWFLDDGDPTSPSYPLAGNVLSPGQHLAFFASETGVYLRNDGDTVFLIRPGGKPGDLYAYPFVEERGKSYCRIPDGSGQWYFGCTPTIDLPNYFGAEPTPTPGAPVSIPAGPYAACPIRDVEASVQFADCHTPGLDIWNPGYWNAPGKIELPYFLPGDRYRTFVE